MPNLLHIPGKSVRMSCGQIWESIFLKHPSPNNYNERKSLRIKGLPHFHEHLDSQGIILKLTPN